MLDANLLKNVSGYKFFHFHTCKVISEQLYIQLGYIRLVSDYIHYAVGQCPQR